MPKLTYVAKEVIAMIEAEGAKAISWKVTGKNHYQFVCKAPDRRTLSLVVSGTPSDNRTNRNARAIVRRFLRGDKQT